MTAIFWTGWAVGILTCVLIATVRTTFVRRRSRLPLASRVLRDTNRWSVLRKRWTGSISVRR